MDRDCDNCENADYLTDIVEQYRGTEAGDELYLKIVEDFGHKYNPLHFYCRLMELGMQKAEARELASQYEQTTYKLIMDHVRQVLEQKHESAYRVGEGNQGK